MAFRHATLAAALLFASLGAGQPHRAVAQDQTVSQLDLQRPQDVNTLNGHLARLAENPRDVTALIGAGEAALALDDARAATGFLARANEISPNNGRIKAGLGHAMLDMQNPGEALKLFGEASRLGFPDTGFLSDRGLARDLTGDTAGAQKDYQAALRAAPEDAELIRRYAVSLGISGQLDASEKVLKPLLYKGDRGAWRDRAFILAMNGRRDEARDIAGRTMPARLAVAIQPYLDRMQALTPAQRAAAVQFGNFPSEVRMAAVQPQQPVVQPVAPQKPVAETAADQRAARKAEKRKQQEARKAAEAAARTAATAPRQPQKTAIAAATPAASPSARIEPQPVPPAPPPMAPNPAPPLVAKAADPAPQAQPTPQAQPAQQLAAADAPRPIQGPPAPEPALVSATPTAASESRAPAVPPPASSPPPAPPTQIAARTLADIMRELQVPDAEKQANAEAVNLAELEMIQQQRKTAKAVAAEKARADATAKAKAAADAKAKAEAAEKARLAKNPSRNWVQVGTGRNLSALAFTMKGLRKKYESLAAKDAWTASWGQTNRLIVGPFGSFDKAKEYEERLKKAGADAFAWRSDAGEAVDKLAN
ncbi:SPOR domain-containing protein [Sphingobium phenoxybenzoativorans]|uniref:SPOR domain-containing protein n=1 Tax=Sphingobium phenoxybenzoativorans TaxID=1592790 RepID=A0A975KBE5_9SPHN|nr:SPOR domain-containing protein [Sphingobium phenoxybenzoativorans]